MANQLSLEEIRQGDILADDAWDLLRPLIGTADDRAANQIFDALRAWTWKTLDRRRRDADLRKWIDLLNRVEAFFAESYTVLSAKIEVLTELLHESLAVAELPRAEGLLRRRHIADLLLMLAKHEGTWVSRAHVMQERALGPANATRLMALMIDVGWIEQRLNGREVFYRISAEGAVCATHIEGNKIIADHESMYWEISKENGPEILNRFYSGGVIIEDKKHIGIRVLGLLSLHNLENNSNSVIKEKNKSGISDRFTGYLNINRHS